MCSRCFAARYQTALLAVASTASPTGSPKSSVKPASSQHPENGQRLAANADHSETYWQVLVELSDYSWRSADSGSILEARHAGNQQAIAAVSDTKLTAIE